MRKTVTAENVQWTERTTMRTRKLRKMMMERAIPTKMRKKKEMMMMVLKAAMKTAESNAWWVPTFRLYSFVFPLRAL